MAELHGAEQLHELDEHLTVHRSRCENAVHGSFVMWEEGEWNLGKEIGRKREKVKLKEAFGEKLKVNRIENKACHMEKLDGTE